MGVEAFIAHHHALHGRRQLAHPTHLAAKFLQRLLLARDRFGVKPLFLAHLSDGSIAFASELKGLLAHPLLRRRISPQAIEAYMTWGYVPDSHSILAGVEKLPAGHFLLLQQGHAPGPPQRWWDIDFTQRERGSEADLSAQLVHRLREAVRSRMVADVPLGAFLSGGVDSSGVVALMSEASSQPVQTCSIGFDVADYDETSYARRVAARFGSDHQERIVATDDFGAIDTLAAMFDEPFADASALPTWRVCQLARERVTVALSGDGADEAFAGYRRQVFHHHEERARRVLPAAVRAPLFGTLGRAWPKADWAPRPLRAKATLLALAESGEAGYARALSVTTPEARAALYSDSFTASLGGFRGEDELIALMRNAPGRSGLDRAQYADLTFWMPGDILTKVDRTSMAVSLEARNPSRQEDAHRHAGGKGQLAAGQVADEEEKQDRGGDINVPESDLPGVIETTRDVGVGLHAGLRGVSSGSDDRAHDGAGDHQTHGCEDRQSHVEQDRPEIAQGRERDQRDHETDKAHQRLDPRTERRNLGQGRGERAGDTREADQIQGIAREGHAEPQDGQGEREQHRLAG